MSPSRKDVWKMFDQISSSYDRINRILSFGMDRGWRRKAASYLPKRENVDLIDLASGTGDQILACFESGAKIRSGVGIDLAAEMLQIGRKKIDTRPFKEKVTLQRADAMALPFPDASFDAATFSFGIRNVPDPLASLKEIHRVLRPGGRCLVLEFSLPRQPLKSFHLFYLRRILPQIGGFFSQRPSAYHYLNETIETFPYGESFLSLMLQADFKSIRSIPMALGAVTLYLGDK